MNEINEVVVPLADVHEAFGFVEILDKDGNPTGAYRVAGDSETAQAGTTFVTAEDGDHEVTVH